MSYTIAKSRISRGNPAFSHWKTLFSPNDKVPVSGIYYCKNCNSEVTCNKGDPFPPQNRDQHGCG